MSKDFPLGDKFINQIPESQAQQVKQEALHWLGDAATAIRQDKVDCCVLLLKKEGERGGHNIALGEPAEIWMQLSVMMHKLEQTLGGKKALQREVARYLKEHPPEH